MFYQMELGAPVVAPNHFIFVGLILEVKQGSSFIVYPEASH